MCKMMISPAIFFIFSKVWFFGIFEVHQQMPKGNSEVCSTFFTCVWFFCKTMTYFVPIGVIKDRITKMYPKYLNGKLWPYHLSCLSILFYMTQPIRLGLLCETSITCRMVENVCNIVVFDSSWLVFTNYCI